MNPQYVIGLDFGTNSARALLVSAHNGEEVASSIWNFAQGTDGVILGRDPNLARQHPADYVEAIGHTLRGVLDSAKQNVADFSPEQVVGIGVDTTGSTPLPVDENGWPLAFQERFLDNPNALAWLWKDHTSIEEAARITELAARIRPQFLDKCGGSYSSEWFWAKILHCLRVDEAVFDAAFAWIECADWIPALLSGSGAPENLTMGVCAIGHKAMWNPAWGGFPDEEFLGELHPELAQLRARLPARTGTIADSVGGLSTQWAAQTGLRESTPIAVGAIDAHLGAVGAGIAPGTLVKTIGTSTCDLMVVPMEQPLADVPGLCGIVPGSITPDFYGLEAGQSAVGDLFNWFVGYIKAGTHEELTRAAGELKAGESGLLALDWNNGNRTVLNDQRLTGLLLGQTLYTTPGEIYRALIEATAFGALTIINRFEEYGVRVERVVNCGGIAEKNPVAMQIYADVIGRPMQISRSSQTCALGAAIAGAVAAGLYPDVPSAQRAMTGLKDTFYSPDPSAHAIYQRLYALYRDLHDAFGTRTGNGNLGHVMKTLLEIRDGARG